MSYSHDKLLYKKSIRFFVTFYFVIEEIVKIFLLEFKLAKRSAVILFIYTIIFISLVFSLWSLLLLICIVLLHSLLHEWLITFILTAGINVLCLVIVLWCIRAYAKNLTFIYTRKHIFGQKGKMSNEYLAAEKADSNY